MSGPTGPIGPPGPQRPECRPVLIKGGPPYKFPPTPNFPYRCCGSVPYNYFTSVCCLNRVYPKKPGYACCGSSIYNSRVKICCSNRLLPRKRGQFCCGMRLYDPKKQVCCNRQPVTKPSSSPFNRCCGSAFYDPSKYLCCSNTVQLRKPGQVCCGTRLYDRSKELCCNRQPVRKTSPSHTACCGRSPYVPRNNRAASASHTIVQINSVAIAK